MKLIRAIGHYIMIKTIKKRIFYVQNYVCLTNKANFLEPTEEITREYSENIAKPIIDE